MRTSSRRLSSFVLAGLVGLALVASTEAAPIAVIGEQVPAATSSFTLDFGLFGGVASARIAQTQFALEIDADLGLARFENYDQQIDPLTLPGGFSTGNIRVEIVPGSSEGSFNDLTGEFETEELYAVHFDGDLSAFQLTSPVILPSSSAGTLTVDALAGGNVNLSWRGVSELINPFDPSTVIQFSYTCSVDAAFSVDAPTLVRLALVPEVLNLGLPEGLESSMVTKLDVSLNQVLAGNNRAAANSLGAFIHQVEAQRGNKLDDEIADLLISDAEAAIALLRGTLITSDVRPTAPGRGSR